MLDRGGLSAIETAELRVADVPVLAGRSGPLIYCAAFLKFADVAELVDAPDLGSGAERRGGSSPLIRTIRLR